MDAVVYIVDTNDRERFPEAKKELDVSVTHLCPLPVCAPCRAPPCPHGVMGCLPLCVLCVPPDAAVV